MGKGIAAAVLCAFLATIGCKEEKKEVVDPAKTPATQPTKDKLGNERR